MAATGETEQALTQQRTTLVSIAAAALLVALKLGVGVASGSLGLVSAGIESSGDVIAAIATFFAVCGGGTAGRRERQRPHGSHPGRGTSGGRTGNRAPGDRRGAQPAEAARVGRTLLRRRGRHGPAGAGGGRGT